MTKWVTCMVPVSDPVKLATSPPEASPGRGLSSLLMVIERGPEPTARLPTVVKVERLILVTVLSAKFVT